MRELARRFRADEDFEPQPGERPERYELRLLPQPVARYEDPASGVVDGGLFLLVYGQNPEIALVIEAGARGDLAAGLGLPASSAISAARSHVHLDGREGRRLSEDQRQRPESPLRGLHPPGSPTRDSVSSIGHPAGSAGIGAPSLAGTATASRL